MFRKGYLKSWAPAKIGVDDQDTEGDVDACNLSCLVCYYISLVAVAYLSDRSLATV